MIGIIVKNKVKIIIFVLIVVLYFTGILQLLYFHGIYTPLQDKKSLEYKEFETRKQYYEKNEKYFNEIAELLINNKDIEGIYKDIDCSSELIETKLKKYSVCSKSSLKNNDIKIINENIKKINIKNIYRNSDNDEKIIFVKTSSWNSSVAFTYCTSIKKCGLTEEYYSNKRGIYINNILNDNWSTSYTDIPII